MFNFSNVRYEKNFLRQVIIRMDFMEYVPNDNIFNIELEKVILKNFSTKGKDQIIRFNSINVVINPSKQDEVATKGEFVEGLQKEYISVDGLNKVILSNKFCAFEINKYTSFENLMEVVHPVLITLFAQNRITFNRTGIRYINIYDSEKIKLQKNYFSNEISALLSSVTNVGEDVKLTRSMCMSEYRTSSLLLNFRYGMFNPDYPNLMNKNSFVLDFDCYTQEPIDTIDQAFRCIEKGHESIQLLFENVITDAMRKVMCSE